MRNPRRQQRKVRQARSSIIAFRMATLVLVGLSPLMVTASAHDHQSPTSLFVSPCGTDGHSPGWGFSPSTALATLSAAWSLMAGNTSVRTIMLFPGVHVMRGVSVLQGQRSIHVVGYPFVDTRCNITQGMGGEADTQLPPALLASARAMQLDVALRLRAGNFTPPAAVVDFGGSGGFQVLSSAVLTVQNVTLQNAVANPAFHLLKSTLHLNGAHLRRCVRNESTTKRGRGGAIHSNMSTVDVHNVWAYDNGAESGGVVYGVSSTFNVTRTLMMGNECNGAGGAMMVVDGSALTSTYAVFHGNKGALGGGLFLRLTTAELRHVVVSSQQCKESTDPSLAGLPQIGCGVFGFDMHNLSVSDVHFVDNKPQDISKRTLGGGLALQNSHRKALLSRCSFRGNIGQPAGLYLSQSAATVQHTAFVNNHRPPLVQGTLSELGGGCLLWESAAEFYNCSWVRNTGEMAVLSSVDSNTTLIGALMLDHIFTDGLLETRGTIPGASSLVMHNATVSNSWASGDALKSILRVSNGVAHLSRVHFFNNTPAALGVLSCEEDAHCRVSDSDFTYHVRTSLAHLGALVRVSPKAFMLLDGCKMYGNDLFSTLVYSLGGTLEVNACFFESTESIESAIVTTEIRGNTTVLNSVFKGCKRGCLQQKGLSFSACSLADRTGNHVELRDTLFLPVREATSESAISVACSQLLAHNVSVRWSDFPTPSIGFTSRCMQLTSVDAHMAHVELDRCTAVGEDGGGLLAVASTLNVTGLHVHSCLADNGAGVWASTDSSLLIEHGHFQNNQAKGNGGAVLATDVDLRSCQLINNTADDSGGAVYVEINGQAVLRDVIAHNNSANQGGAVYMTVTSAGDMSNTSFSNNSAASAGGAIACVSSRLSMEKVSAKHHMAVLEGGVLSLTQCQLHITGFGTDDSHAISGGLVHAVRSTAHFQDTNITRTTATAQGGAFHFASSVVTLTSVKCSNSRALGDHGGVLAGALESHITASNCSFTHGRAGTSGGLLFVSDESSLTLHNCELSHGQAGNAGGGLMVTQRSQATMDSVVVSDCVAAEYGGGIAATVESTASITATQLHRDTSGLSGGALYLHSSTATVRNANMTACHSQSHGGAIGVYTGATLTLTDSSLERNVAGNPTAAPAGVCMSQLSGTACGGGMAVVGANARANVSRCSWTHNTAENKGGGSYVAQQGLLAVVHALLNANSAATRGGALAADETAILRIHEGSLQQNTAQEGGSLSCESASVCVVEYSNFSHNLACASEPGTSISGGGAIYTTGSSIQLLRVELNNNSARASGGAVSSSDSSLSLDFVTVAGNTANLDGGGLALWSQSCPSSSSSSGHNEYGSLTWQHTHIFSNVARQGAGGGSFYSSPPNCSVAVPQRLCFCSLPAPDHSACSLRYLPDGQLTATSSSANSAWLYGDDAATSHEGVVVTRAPTSVPFEDAFVVELALFSACGAETVEGHHAEATTASLQLVSQDSSRATSVSSAQGTRNVPFTASGSLALSLSLTAALGSCHKLAFTVETAQQHSLTAAHTVCVASCGRGRESVNGECLQCSSGTYNVNDDGVCRPCPNGAVCPGGATLLTAVGWWRVPAGANSVEFVRCRGQACCPQGACDESTTCTASTTGPMCSQCADAHGRNIFGDCVRCQEEAQALFAIIAFLCLHVLLYFIFVRPMARDATIPFSVAEMQLVAPFLVLTFVQMVPLLLSFQPSWFARLMFFNFDVVTSFTPGSGCLLVQRTTTLLLVRMATLVATWVCLFVFGAVRGSRSIGAKQRSQNQQHPADRKRCGRITLLYREHAAALSLFTHSQLFRRLAATLLVVQWLAVMDIAGKTFRCTDLADGRSVLLAEPSQQCWEGSHLLAAVVLIVALIPWTWAVVRIVLWPLCSLSWTLSQSSDLPSWRTRCACFVESRDALHLMAKGIPSFLVDTRQPPTAMFVDLAARTLVAVTVTVTNRPELAMVVCVLGNGFALSLQAFAWRPYAAPLLNVAKNLSWCALLGVCYSLVGDANRETHSVVDNTFSNVVVGILLCVHVALWVVEHWYPKWNKLLQDTEEDFKARPELTGSPDNVRSTPVPSSSVEPSPGAVEMTQPRQVAGTRLPVTSSLVRDPGAGAVGAGNAVEDTQDD